MKDQQTISQFLKVKDFPFEIKNKNGKPIYSEYSSGYWLKSEYDDKGNQIRYENSKGFWIKSEYDEQGNSIRYENSDGYWLKSEYDDQGNNIRYETSEGYWSKSEYDDEGNEIYSEDSDGYIVDERPKQMIELTLQDIAKLKGVDVSQIRIKE
jgi:YD repeat-containing protein